MTTTQTPTIWERRYIFFQTEKIKAEALLSKDVLKLTSQLVFFLQAHSVMSSFAYCTLKDTLLQDLRRASQNSSSSAYTLQSMQADLDNFFDPNASDGDIWNLSDCLALIERLLVLVKKK